MSGNPFLQFIGLVSFDQKVHSLENDIINTDAEIVSFKQQEEAIINDLNEMDKAIYQLKKKVDEYELEMKSLDQKEKEKKQLLDRLSDYKEYQAIKAEIEVVQRMQVEHEGVILDAWNKLENMQLAETKKKSASAQQREQLHEKIEQARSKLESLRVQHDNLIMQRAEKEQVIPADWLEKYSMMRARVADPVVGIVQQCCSACSQIITSQEFSRAKRGALIQCQKCYRLLYYPDAVEKKDL